MTDRPIIFSAPMIRALLDGRKTQTRRLATSPLRRCEPGDRLWVRESFAAEELSRPPKTVKATPRERRHNGRTTAIVCDDLDGADGLRYLADDTWAIIENSQEAGDRWFEAFHYGSKNGERPKGHRGKSISSIHMPRWASRLTLIVEAVRVQRLQDISEEDAEAEGVVFETADPPFWYVPGILPHSVTGAEIVDGAVTSYAKLWAHLHGADSWLSNPEVVAITSRTVRANIERVEQ